MADRILSADWLDEVEVGIRLATDVLTSPSSGRVLALPSELNRIVVQLEQFCTTEAKAPQPDLRSRLISVRKQLAMLQILIRHALAAYCALEQLDTASVIGYGPQGLERAL
ncbi:MAG: hypothetical protein ABI824_18130 [Acidobacteriota bacterium]